MKQQPSRLSSYRMKSAIRHLESGGVIAYPTEAVFGLGCDPENRHAVDTLLNFKQRSRNKGLILIAAEFRQLLPYIELHSVSNLNRILRSWPGPVTWLIKARPAVCGWLRGRHESIAVRVTAHPLAAELSRKYGKPLVSTSANPSGAAPARTALKTRLYFGGHKILIVKGAVGGATKPSSIYDANTLQRLR